MNFEVPSTPASPVRPAGVRHDPARGPLALGDLRPLRAQRRPAPPGRDVHVYAVEAKPPRLRRVRALRLPRADLDACGKRPARGNATSAATSAMMEVGPHAAAKTAGARRRSVSRMSDSLQISTEDLPETAAEGSARWLAEQLSRKDTRFEFFEQNGRRLELVHLRTSHPGPFSGRGKAVAYRGQYDELVGVAQEDDALGIPHVLDGVRLDPVASVLWREICAQALDLLKAWHDRDNATTYAVSVEAQRG